MCLSNIIEYHQIREGVLSMLHRFEQQSMDFKTCAVGHDPAQTCVWSAILFPLHRFVEVTQFILQRAAHKAGADQSGGFQ